MKPQMDTDISFVTSVPRIFRIGFYGGGLGEL
jgi:hypothetical protein